MFVQEDSLFDGCPCSGCNLPRFVLPLLLGLLADGPQHGYQLLQRLRDFHTLTARGQACLGTWAGTLTRYQEDIACIVRFLRRGRDGGGLS